MKAYKGFDKNMQCRGFQYEEGKTYETDKAELCNSGFHACECPLDVMRYYEPSEGSIYREVELDDVSEQRDGDNTKRVGKKITIGAELGIPGLVKAHVEWVKEQTKADNSSGRYARIGSSGYAASIGSSGDDARIGSSGDAARIGSSGRYARIGSSGDDASIECVSDHAVVVCAGKNAKVKAPEGTWIALAEYGEFDGIGYPCIGLKATVVDGETIKADTWYTLKDGEFVEVNGGADNER